MASKKIFNLDDEKDIEEIHKLLYDDSDDDSGDNSSGSKRSDRKCKTPEPYVEVVEEDYDTDASEKIEDRYEDSETDQSDADSSTSEEEDDDLDSYIAIRKQNNRIIDFFFLEKKPYPANRRTAKHNLIMKLPGVIGVAKNISSVLETWKCLFGETMLNQIVTFTNQYIDNVKSKYTRARDAQYTDLTEIKAFIGLLYLAGMYKGGRLNLEDLWETDGFGVEIFRLTMSLKRFRFLFQAIRFDNRDTREERKKVDRLAPIRDFFEKFVQNCQSCYSMGENVTLDEKLEPFRGRCSFIQYIPSKPAKYGIKIFALVDSKTFYTSKLEIYAGKQPDGPYAISNKSLDVVNRMIQPIHNSGRNVTADNWFSDVSLLKSLAEEHRLSFVGTLKKNKWQIPHQLKDIKHREVCSSIFAFRKEGTLVSYVPQNKSTKKNVILISSMHQDDKIDQATGDKKKPEIITFYNQTKAGVDMVDKMCSAYSVARNTRRWSMVVFYSMLNVAGINSMIIFLGNQNKPIPRRKFLKQLGKELVQEHLVRRSKISCLPLSIKFRLNEIVPQTNQAREIENNGENTSRKRCKFCQQEKKTRLTRYSCKYCGSYLCLQHTGFMCPKGCEKDNLNNEDGV